MLSNLLVANQIVKSQYLYRNEQVLAINLMDVREQPRVVIYVGKPNFISVLDSGSTFNILPYNHFKQLNLCQTTRYTIQSVTHREPDAILGSVKLNFKIDNCDGTSQIINCPFLVLKEHLSLPTILL